MKGEDNMLEVEMNKFTKEEQKLIRYHRHPQYIPHPFKDVAIDKVKLKKEQG